MLERDASIGVIRKERPRCCPLRCAWAELSQILQPVFVGG
jgi:hypothetical protein